MKKDQHVIACIESPESAPAVIEYARHWAQRLNGKGVILLNVSADGNNRWLSQYGLPYIGLKGNWKTAIDGLPTALGGILAVAGLNPRAPRSSFTNRRTLLRNFRECKIAYLVVEIATENTKNGMPPTTHPSAPERATLTLDYHRESKEKLIWGSYIARYIGASLTVAMPDYKDSNLRQLQIDNQHYMEKLYTSLDLKYTTSTIPHFTFKNSDIATIERLKPDVHVALTTDIRQRDLGDWLFGAPEMHLLSSKTPILFLNSRDDLYVLCD